MTSSMQVMGITASMVILGGLETIARMIGGGTLTKEESIHKVETTLSQLERVMTQSGVVMEMTSSMQVMEITPSTVAMGTIH